MKQRNTFYHLYENFHFMQFLKQGCLEKRGRSHRGYYSRMKRYIYDFWNVVDLLSYLLLIVALFIRHFHPSETFTLARRMYALSLLVMYLRFLEVFLIHRKLGPTLIMIKEMVFVTSLHFAALNIIMHISNANIFFRISNTCYIQWLQKHIERRTTCILDINIDNENKSGYGYV